jgi:signal peptidase I
VSNEFKEYNRNNFMEVNEENTQNTSLPHSSGKNSANFWRELLKLILLALVVVVPFRLYVAQPFIVDGASMDPTFEDGEYLIVDELSYRFKDPARGEVLIFKYPKDPSKYFIKRIIGLPGERIFIDSGEVVIFNGEHPEGLTLSEPYVALEKVENGSFSLGENEYFVMGDNRLQSADSRLWGSVPRENIVGRPIVRFIPPALFPGAMAYEEDNTN